MTIQIRNRALGLLALALFASGAGADTLSAQIPGIGGAIRRAAGNVRMPDLNSLVGRDHPITTSLPDARWAVDSLDNFRPREAVRSIAQLQRTPNGGFVLQPGSYAYQSQSYCLKAGTHGPGGGDGYLYAPTKGPAEDQVMSILRNSVNHPEISQQDIQYLLWAIIARTKFEDLPAEQKATAARLLTPRQIATLNRSALDLVPGASLDAAMQRVPGPVRQIIQAEAKLRQMMTTPGTTFQQLEAVAVLAGMAPMGEGSRAVPSGRWSLHPDGYYVRYIPSGYSSTRVELWVPQGSPAVGKEFDPATHIAVPGNTARQRLVQSGRMHQTR